MIIDVFKTKRYKEAHLTTFVKDFIIFFGTINILLIIVIAGLSFIKWYSPIYFVVLYQNMLYFIIRIGLCIALLLAIYFHKASHKAELEKLERLRQ